MKIAILTMLIVFFAVILQSCIIIGARTDERADQIFAQITRDEETKIYKTAEECFQDPECVEAYEDAHGVMADSEGMARD